MPWDLSPSRSSTLPSSLRRKTLLIIAVAMIGLVGGMYFLSRALLMRSFTKLEADFASENIQRASSALTNEIDTLDRTTSEYGSWDQTYAFVHGHNPNYTNFEFPSTTFLQLKINFVAIFDQHGTLLFSKGFDPELRRRNLPTRRPEGPSQAWFQARRPPVAGQPRLRPADVARWPSAGGCAARSYERQPRPGRRHCGHGPSARCQRTRPPRLGDPPGPDRPTRRSACRSARIFKRPTRKSPRATRFRFSR